MGKVSALISSSFPSFSLQDDEGTNWSEANLLGKWSVIYFYPKDGSPGCTAQSCQFRDEAEDFSQLNAQIIGVSSDSIERHQAFRKQHNLPFSILNDKGGALRKALKIRKTLGLIPGRVTFVVDAQGIIRHVINSQLSISKHIESSKAFLKSQSQ